jgi:hypothetical protein
MHDRIDVRALHESKGRARQSSARRLRIARFRRARSDAPYQSPGSWCQCGHERKGALYRQILRPLQGCTWPARETIACCVTTGRTADSWCL